MTCVGQHPRGADRRHVASESHDQGQERAPWQTDETHGAIGHHGRAGHVPGVLQQRQQQEHDRHQRHEGEQHPHAADQTVDEEALDPGAPESHRTEHRGRGVTDGACEEAVQGVLQRCRRSDRQLEDSPHDGEEDDRAQPRGGDPTVYAVGPCAHVSVRRDHRGIDRGLDPGEPLIGLAEFVVGDLTAHTRRSRRSGENLHHPAGEVRITGAVPRVEADDRDPQMPLQGGDIHVDTSSCRDVRHRQGHDDPGVLLADLRQQVQGTGQPRCVDHYNDGVGTLGRILDAQHRVCEGLVRGHRIEAVRPGQIHQRHRTGFAGQAPFTPADLHGRAGPVPHAATCAGQGVEKSGLADVGCAYQGHHGGTTGR